MICRGTKTEFRIPVHVRWGERTVECPTPVVGYAMQRWQAEADYRLFVVEALRVEPLGSISAESLRAEGFADISAFKSYWRRRYQTRGWRPLDRVNVLTVRPWREPDVDIMGTTLIRRLYGPFLPDDS